MGLFTRKTALEKLNTPVPSKPVTPHSGELTVPRKEEALARGVSDVNLILYFKENAPKRLRAIHKELNQLQDRMASLQSEQNELELMLGACMPPDEPAVFARHGMRRTDSAPTLLSGGETEFAFTPATAGELQLELEIDRRRGPAPSNLRQLYKDLEYDL